MGWKLPLCKWHTFWMAPCLICYFFVILFYTERKWLLMRNLAAAYPWSPSCLQNFNILMLDRSMEMLKNSWIFQKFPFKWKIVKNFVRPKQRATLRKLFSVLPSYTRPDKTLIRLWHKNVLKFFYIL